MGVSPAGRRQGCVFRLCPSGPFYGSFPPADASSGQGNWAPGCPPWKGLAPCVPPSPWEGPHGSPSPPFSSELGATSPAPPPDLTTQSAHWTLCPHSIPSLFRLILSPSSQSWCVDVIFSCLPLKRLVGISLEALFEPLSWLRCGWLLVFPVLKGQGHLVGSPGRPVCSRGT